MEAQRPEGIPGGCGTTHYQGCACHEAAGRAVRLAHEIEARRAAERATEAHAEALKAAEKPCTLCHCCLDAPDRHGEILGEWVARAESAESRLAEAVGVLREITEQLDRVHADPAYQGVWGLYAAHGCQYVGLTYTRELDLARTFLARLDEKETK